MGEAWKLSEHYQPGMTQADVHRVQTRERMRRIRSDAMRMAASPVAAGRPAYVADFMAWRERQRGWKRDVADALWCRMWWHDEVRMPKPSAEILHGKSVQVSPPLAGRVLNRFGLPPQLFLKCTRHIRHNDCRPTSTGGRPCASAA